MRLKFEGQAAVDDRFVNFAGYYNDASGHRNDVLCRISHAALNLASGLSNQTADELLAAYQRNSGLINRLAAAQFSAGITHPSILPEDIPTNGLNDSIVA